MVSADLIQKAADSSGASSMSQLLTGTGATGQLAHEESVRLLRANPIEEPPFTLEWVRDTIGYYSNIFSRFHRNCRTADVFFLNDFDFEVPEDSTKVRLGSFHSVIDVLTSHVSAEFIDNEVPPPGPRGRARAEKISKFLDGMHHMIEQNTPVRRTIAQQIGMYDTTFVKMEFDSSQWGEFPDVPDEGEDDSEYKEQVKEELKRRHVHFPIIAEVINPQELLWDTSSRTPRWVIRGAEMEAADVHAMYPEWKNPILHGTVKFVEVWTSTHAAYIADGRWAMAPRRHGYHMNPLVQFEGLQGLKTVGGKPENRWRGIGHGLWDMLRAESQLMSHYLTLVGKSTWPTEDFRGPPALTARTMAEYSSSPGAKNYMPPSVTKEVAEVAEAPTTILTAYEMLGSAIEADTISKVAKGQRPTGVSTGYQSAVLTGVASLKFGPVKEGMQRGLQKLNELGLHIVENVMRDSITVWGKSEGGLFDARLTPREINGHYISIVKINTVSPEEAERKLNTWKQMWIDGFVDWSSALRNAGVNNPLEVIAMRSAEDLEQMPEIQQAFGLIASESLGSISQALASIGADPGSAEEIQGLAAQLSGGTGQFTSGNQPPQSPGSERSRVDTSTQPVLPGSLREQGLIGRQQAGPRTGPQRIPGGDLPPGIGQRTPI